MKYYLLDQVARIFNIDRSTLWRWRASSHISSHRARGDYRRRFLTEEQVQRLARAHHRQILTQKLITERLARLEDEVGALKQEIEQASKEGEEHRRAISGDAHPPHR